MKKFVKLAAVFAALVLALSCFVACSSDDGDDESALEGLWYYDEGEGSYVVGNKMYSVFYVNGEYYYIEDDATEFTVSGNEITWKYEDGYTEKSSFEISGNKLTVTYYYEDGEEDKVTLTKVNEKPKKLSWKELEELFGLGNFEG